MRAVDDTKRGCKVPYRACGALVYTESVWLPVIKGRKSMRPSVTLTDPCVYYHRNAGCDEHGQRRKRG